ncbi:MAG: DUF4255 domain-containing protein [Bacteroidota bacterium]
MINSALQYVARELNRYLMRKFNLQEDKAILGSILDETGAVPEGNKDKVLVTLVNMEQETNYQYINFEKTKGNSNYQLNTPFNFNMDVLITALFSNYNEALKFLSETIYFFQSKNLFNHENSPGLDPKIQQLSFEVIKLSYHEVHSLWTALGAKYMPSVLFKVRLLSFQSDQVQQVDTTISDVGPSVNPNG